MFAADVGAALTTQYKLGDKLAGPGQLVRSGFSFGKWFNLITWGSSTALIYRADERRTKPASRSNAGGTNCLLIISVLIGTHV